MLVGSTAGVATVGAAGVTTGAGATWTSGVAVVAGIDGAGVRSSTGALAALPGFASPRSVRQPSAAATTTMPTAAATAIHRLRPFGEAVRPHDAAVCPDAFASSSDEGGGASAVAERPAERSTPEMRSTEAFERRGAYG